MPATISIKVYGPLLKSARCKICPRVTIIREAAKGESAKAVESVTAETQYRENHQEKRCRVSLLPAGRMARSARTLVAEITRARDGVDTRAARRHPSA